MIFNFAVPEEIQNDMVIEAIEKQQKLRLYLPSKMTKKYEKYKNIMELAYGGVGRFHINSTGIASEMDFEVPFAKENVRCCICQGCQCFVFSKSGNTATLKYVNKNYCAFF